MDLPVSFYFVAVLAVLVTGISKSGFGGGLGVMSVPVMSLFVAPQFAAAVLMPILLAMDVLVVARYRRNWDRAVLLSMLPGALAGLVVGALVFEWMDADMVRFLIGLLALVFVVQFVVGRRRGVVAAGPRPVGQVLGAISGFASFVAHAGGPPVKGYLLRQNLGKTDFVGTNTVFFFILNAIKTVAYGAAGTLDAQSVLVSLGLAPFLFVGVYAGLGLHHLVDQKVFVAVVYLFLTVTAVKLLSDSIHILPLA